MSRRLDAAWHRVVVWVRVAIIVARWRKGQPTVRGGATDEHAEPGGGGGGGAHLPLVRVVLRPVLADTHLRGLQQHRTQSVLPYRLVPRIPHDAGARAGGGMGPPPAGGPPRERSMHDAIRTGCALVPAAGAPPRRWGSRVTVSARWS